MMKSFAIVLVCYKRIDGVKRLLGSLEKVDFSGRNDIYLIFSIDNSGSSQMEDFANEYYWPYGEKIVRTFPQRQGLKNHILQCGDYTEQFDIVCVLEDDIYVSNSMYHYAYQASEFYWDDDSIAGISLYSFQKNWLNWLVRFEPQRSVYDAYFLKVAQSWGQVWLRNKWSKFKEWYELNKVFTKSSNIPAYLQSWPESSWLKYHDRYLIETNRYFVYPYVSLTTNFSDAGEHAHFTVNDHQVELQFGKELYSFPAFSDEAIRYDEYMNREGLERALGIPSEDLCVDFYNTNTAKRNRRYLLTLNHYNYKIINSYSLSLRPLELSVIQDLQGDGIYLYDTSAKEDNKKFDGDFNRRLYSIRSHSSKEILRFAIKLRYIDVITRLRGKINKIIKK